MHVFLDRRFDKIIGLGVSLCLIHGRANLLHDRVQVWTRHLLAGACSIHRTTPLVSKHDQHSAVQVFHCVLNASECHRVGNVACGPHNKKISQALIENQTPDQLGCRNTIGYRFGDCPEASLWRSKARSRAAACQQQTGDCRPLDYPRLQPRTVRRDREHATNVAWEQQGVLVQTPGPGVITRD